MGGNNAAGHVLRRGALTIPKALRERFGLPAGAAVRFVNYGGIVGLWPVPADPISAGHCLLRGYALTESLLRCRCEED